MSWTDTYSQAQNSTAYSVIKLLFFPIFFFISLLGIIGGVIERKFINKRLERPPEKLAVVITGCSTGFGFNLAKSLASKGVKVYAGVRKVEDGEKLKNSSTHPDNVIPILADVTNPGQLKEAAEIVKNGLVENGLRLLALVNNAGYGYYSSIESANIESMKKMFEVNVYGVVNATQVFVPLLRELGSKGPLSPRIINISSGAGQLVLSPSGTYCSSKFALEAISDAMRMEFTPWNIKVCIIEPGRFQTEFQDKAYIDYEHGGIGAITPEVENHYRKLTQMTNEASAKHSRPNNMLCVKVIEDSLFDTIPLARYLSGTDVQLGVPLVKFLKTEKITDMIMGKKWRYFQK